MLSNKRFPWLSYRDIELGMCPVRAVRVAYTGELGWELHYPIEFGATCGICWSVGEKHGLKGVGARAQNWLRQEKSYRAFGNELGRDATPLGGRPAALCRSVERFQRQGQDAGNRHPVEMRDRADRRAGPIPIRGARKRCSKDGEKIGRLTSGGYSVAFGKQIGMGYVSPELAVPGTKLKVKMLLKEWDAVVTEDSPFDPSNARIRIDG